ncbi:hypothetical protein AWH56_003315 [Anaerobacillus isosaccharinicus]|uniref:Uncharacterized protein n=1 Tax=Anaerobacillus isosaccharinicus TaxID=1532552 RepID=A0A7S7L922_9BACI|nr:hypothetical protein [Anaerobacillus isosaccharinicus]MBA5584945.1 hypothetical protein [Anaerobacillus isosaccharinicus]QOY36699.1 hypothetical protein AWH56_003315 [Anaerobacillus isosaccharinicus]
MWRCIGIGYVAGAGAGGSYRIGHLIRYLLKKAYFCELTDIRSVILVFEARFFQKIGK